MSGACCPIGSEPALFSDYTPKGKEIDLDGLTCYVKGSGDKSVIVFYDIFGYNGGRTKLICDQIASQGYYVILPDIYHGEYWPADKPKDTLMDWVKTFPWENGISVDCDKVLKHLKEKSADKSIGCVGFCAGAFSVFHLCQNTMITCGASCHPSVHICGLFGETPDGLAELLNCPQLIYTAGDDQSMYKLGGKVYEIVDKKFGDKNDLKDFPEMKHGWVTRSDVTKPEAKRDVKLAMEGLVNFFAKTL